MFLFDRINHMSIADLDKLHRATGLIVEVNNGVASSITIPATHLQPTPER